MAGLLRGIHNSYYYHRYYSQFTSNTTALLLGGVKFVLLATQTSLAFKCCLPMLGKSR